MSPAGEWAKVTPISTMSIAVKYEIGEHPLADIAALNGGGGLEAAVTVGALVPGGKAEQAGVAKGDALVAVSGRPDFQLLPAERLLETLPTPTLLVFAKDRPPIHDLRENSGSSYASAEAAEGEVLKAQTAPPPGATGRCVSLGGLESVEEARENQPPSLIKAALDRNVDPENAGGVAGVSWEVSRNPDPGVAEGHVGKQQDGFTREQSIPIRSNTTGSARSAGSAKSKNGTPKPRSAPIVRRDDGVVGIPSSRSLFGPDVQVEVCDQVTFDPHAILLMQGLEGPRRTSDGANASARVGLSEGTSDSSGTWMYELPRQEARDLVEIARRDASRGSVEFGPIASEAGLDLGRPAELVDEIVTFPGRGVSCETRAVKQISASAGFVKRGLSPQSTEPAPLDLTPPWGAEATTTATCGNGTDEDIPSGARSAKNVDIDGPFYFGAGVTPGSPRGSLVAHSTASGVLPSSLCHRLLEADEAHLRTSRDAAPRGPRLGPCGAKSVTPPMVQLLDELLLTPEGRVFDEN